MTKKTYWYALAGLFAGALLVCGACGSAPPAQPEPPVAETPAEIPPETPPEPAPPAEDPSADASALGAVGDAKAAAENARRLALAVGGNTAYPDDWKDAENLLGAAQGMATASKKDADAAAAQYQEAEGRYNDIFQKALPAYAAKRAAELSQARQAALDAGWASDDPALAAADKAVADAAAKFGSGDFVGGEDGADNAALLYQAMVAISQARKTAGEITDKGLARYDQKGFNAASALADGAAKDCAAGTGKSAFDNADSARKAFSACLSNAWKNYAVEQGGAAGTARKNALDAKANVASRDNFSGADAAYNKAAAAYKAAKFEDAVAFYAESATLFDAAQKDALEKRARADAALEAARQKAAESDSIAQNAESVLQEGGAE
jgi:hypothetical protein